jgi:hypothetical protein
MMLQAASRTENHLLQAVDDLVAVCIAKEAARVS